MTAIFIKNAASLSHTTLISKVLKQSALSLYVSILVTLTLGSPMVGALEWVAVGENGTILRSSDGIVWEASNSGTPETLRGVYFDGATTWVAAGQNGTLVNSQNAADWGLQVSGIAAQLWGAFFADGQWIVTGGSQGYILGSTNSTDWEVLDGPRSFSLYDIGYDGSGLYLAAGADASLAKVLTSSDGVMWEQNPLTSSIDKALYGIAYVNGLWVGVGDGGTILTSSDPSSGIWTVRSSNTTEPLRDVVFNGSDQVVAVGYNGTILTSEDGIEWTAQISGVADEDGEDGEDLWGIEYDPAGLYVAVGTFGTILTSNNGEDWVKRASPSLQWLRDVAVGRIDEVNPPDPDPISPTGIPATPLWSIMLAIIAVLWNARRYRQVKSLDGIDKLTL